MGKIKNYRRGIGKFIASEKGQRFFNFAYSIGAAIVIWGALFKILHLPGGNTLLSIGMGTEVLMFVLTAFDRPPKEYHWEEVFPVLDTHNEEDRPDLHGGSGGSDSGVVVSGGMAEGVEFPEGAVIGGPTIIGGGGGVIIGGGVSAEGLPEGVTFEGASVEGAHGQGGMIVGGGGYVGPVVTEGQARAAAGIPAGIELSEEDSKSLSESISKMAAAADQLSRMAELTNATQQYLDSMASIAQEMEHLRSTTQALNQVSDVLLESYRAITENSENITRSSSGYVEQMQDLNRNISGLNTIYEIQLKSVASQLDSIDRVNRGIKDIRDMYEKGSEQSARYCEETEKMARNMTHLNAVYEKMLQAMTMNLYRPGMSPSGGVDISHSQMGEHHTNGHQHNSSETNGYQTQPNGHQSSEA